MIDFDFLDIDFIAAQHWFYGAPPLSAYTNVGPFVYFIGSGDTVKIGWSKHPEKRVDQIRRGGHVLRPSAGLIQAPELLAYLPGTERDELVLHARFNNSHDRGEWFHRTPELDALIEETLHKQCSLEVAAHIAHYKSSVITHGWPAREHDREALIQQQEAKHHEWRVA